LPTEIRAIFERQERLRNPLTGAGLELWLDPFAKGSAELLDSLDSYRERDAGRCAARQDWAVEADEGI
jgi:hypothetical protein